MYHKQLRSIQYVIQVQNIFPKFLQKRECFNITTGKQSVVMYVRKLTLSWNFRKVASGILSRYIGAIETD